MTKDDFVLACVIAVGASATGFALVFMVKFGVHEESLFALIGAIIGAAATVAGAAWLADRHRIAERNIEVSLLVKACAKLLHDALAAQKMEPGVGMPWPIEYRPLLYRLAESSGNVHAITVEALAHGKALSFIHRTALRRVQFAIDAYLRFWTDANAEGELEPWDERSFPEVTRDIVHECKIAISEFNGRTSFLDEI